MIVDLASVAVALDVFEEFDENMRAEVYHAIDLAPVYPPQRLRRRRSIFRARVTRLGCAFEHMFWLLTMGSVGQ